MYKVTGGLNTGLADVLADGQSAAIYDVCSRTMGGVGVALAMVGVIVCPITSGDTAFRSARLTLADWLHLDQGKYMNRLKLCIPVLGVGAILGVGNALGAIDYTVIWRYFSWTNQTLAMIVSLGGFDVSGKRKEELLDHSCSGNLYERCIEYVFHTGAGVSGKYNKFQDCSRCSCI